MKRIFCSIILSLMTILSFGQSTGEKMVVEKSDGTTVEYKVEEVKSVYFTVPNIFSVTPGELFFGSESGSKQTLHITSNMDWQIVNIPSWLTASAKSGSTSKDVVFTTANAASKDESATMFVIAGESATPIAVKREAPRSFLTASLSDNNFLAEGGKTYLTIKSNVEWSLDLSNDIKIVNVLPLNEGNVTFSKTKGSGDDVVTITVAKNETASTRTGNLTVLENGLPSKYTFTLNQDAAPLVFNVDKEKVELSSASQEFAVDVECNAAVQMTCSSWISLKSQNNGKYIFLVDENKTTETREGEITFTTQGGSKTVSVAQKGISPQPVSPIFAEPCTQWGCSKNDVKQYMTGYTLYSEETSMLVYIGKYKETLISYTFENGKMKEVAVIVSASDASKADIISQLSETYMPMGENNGDYILMSQDGNTFVIIRYNSEVDAYFVYYIGHDNEPDDDTTIYFEEPYTSWNASRSAVSTAMNNKGYKLIGQSTSAEEDYYLAYDNKYLEYYSMYYFNSILKLDMVNVFFLQQDASCNEINKFVESTLSYVLIYSNNDGAKIYATPDNNSAVVVFPANFSDGTPIVIVQYVNISELMGNNSAKALAKGLKEGSVELNYRSFRITPEIEAQIKAQKCQRIMKMAGSRLEMSNINKIVSIFLNK